MSIISGTFSLNFFITDFGSTFGILFNDVEIGDRTVCEQKINSYNIFVY